MKGDYLFDLFCPVWLRIVIVVTLIIMLVLMLLGVKEVYDIFRGKGF